MGRISAGKDEKVLKMNVLHNDVNVYLKVVKMVNFMICTFYYTEKNANC